MDEKPPLVNAIIMTSRFPWPPYTGDRIRAAMWMDALAPGASVTLIAPAGELPSAYRYVRHVVVRRSLRRLAAGALSATFRGLPWQTLMAAGYDWRRAVDEAGPADVCVVMLSRLHPWVAPLPRARTRLLDAVDSLGFSARERSRAAKGPARWFWAMESDRNLRMERALGRDYESIFVVSDTETDAFEGSAITLSSGIAERASSTAAREFDFGFWGRLGYFANEDAARVLLETIWPRIRAELPEARLVIAGAQAPGWLRRRSGADGVMVLSPVADMTEVISRVRVALFPVRFGTGQLNKVLEAAAGGCAIVATPRALAGLPHLADSAVLREQPEDLGRAAVETWRHGERDRTAALKTVLRHHYSRQNALDRMTAAVHTAGTGERS